MILKKAFTLAEVLITLSILGVVAVVAIPNVSTKVKRVETQTKIKKFYSTIDNLMGRTEIENNIPFNQWDLTADKNQILDNYIVPYLNIAKDCRNDNCEAYNFYRQNGTTIWGEFSPFFILKDGTLIALIDIDNSVPNPYGNIRIRYDINGVKGPNIAGKDIFTLGVYKNAETGSYDLGTESFSINKKDINNLIRLCKNETSSGMGGLDYCSGWIYSNGFKIPKDYPWL